MLSLWSGTLTALFGALVLLGWALDAPVLVSVVPGMARMKPNAALSSILAGVALILLARRGRWALPLGKILATSIVLIGSLTLLEHQLSWNVGIDQLLFAAARLEDTRMPPATAIGFIMMGSSLVMLDTRGRSRILGEIFAFAVLGITLAFLLGLVYGATGLLRFHFFSAMALPAALALFALGIGVLWAPQDRGLVQMLTARNAAGLMLRWLLPAVVTIPLILGWARLHGERIGLYDTLTGTALFALANIMLFGCLIGWSAVLVWRADRQREQFLAAERAARAEAERLGRAKDEFLATLSHELRTPLNAILGWAQLLQRRSTGSADIARGLGIIERNARLQCHLIADLLEMSRIISGKLRLDVRRVVPAVVVNAALDTMRPAVEGKGITLATALDWRLPPIKADPERLQQVLSNLLANAIKFTSKGGRVDVVLQRVGASLELVVRDTGEGIEPAVLPHIFGRFVQADASSTRSHGGLGLGLAIVKQLVELHGGTVRAESAGRGRGATFTVSLAFEPPLPTPARRDPQSVIADALLAGESEQMTLKGLRVLVVEDDDDARDLLRRALEDSQVEVQTASSAAQAIQLVRMYRPDVLVSDIGMPGEDGYELIRMVRELSPEEGSEVPAIALTAYARPEDRTRVLAAGYQLHLSKPVDPSKVVVGIASLCGLLGIRSTTGGG